MVARLRRRGRRGIYRRSRPRPVPHPTSLSAAASPARCLLHSRGRHASARTRAPPRARGRLRGRLQREVPARASSPAAPPRTRWGPSTPARRKGRRTGAGAKGAVGLRRPHGHDGVEGHRLSARRARAPTTRRPLRAPWLGTHTPPPLAGPLRRPPARSRPSSTGSTRRLQREQAPGADGSPARAPASLARTPL